MDTGNISAIISATAGITGVLLGNSFLTIKEWLIARNKRKKEMAFLAIIVVSKLDRFANDCLAVAHDDGTEHGVPAGDHEDEYVPTVSEPEIQPLDFNVDWKTLPPNLMYKILQIPDRRERIKNLLNNIIEYSNDFPENTEYFFTRREEYCNLGIEVSEISKQLREVAALPPSDWNRTKQLKQVANSLKKKRSDYKRQIASEPPIELDI